MQAAELPIDLLAQRCAEETAKYRYQQPSDPQYCFELFRRALADESSEAFTLVYRIYERQVESWVYGHPRFSETDESPDYFVGWAMRSFYFGIRGAKFANFSSLPALLGYLKTCVHTSIMQYLREQRRTFYIPIDSVLGLAETPDLTQPLEAGDLWAQILELLPAPEDQRLAHYVFTLGLKPRQIHAAHPETWANAREVSVALYRIRTVLRNRLVL